MKGNSKNLPHDTRHNTGNVGAMKAKLRPNVGTKKIDNQDKIKGALANKAFRAQMNHSNSANPR